MQGVGPTFAPKARGIETIEGSRFRRSNGTPPATRCDPGGFMIVCYGDTSQFGKAFLISDNLSSVTLLLPRRSRFRSVRWCYFVKLASVTPVPPRLSTSRFRRLLRWSRPLSLVSVLPKSSSRRLDNPLMCCAPALLLAIPWCFADSVL